MKIDIISEEHKDKEGKFNMDKALNDAGYAAGICYNPGGLSAIKKEPSEKTTKRVDNNLKLGHYSIFDHTFIKMHIKDIPKILAMIINNERQYSATEMSYRYVNLNDKAAKDEISHDELAKYTQWSEILKNVINDEYPNQFKKFKIKTLANENARYFINVHVPTEIVYTTSLRQLNSIAARMLKFINDNKNMEDSFTKQVSKDMKEFVFKLDQLNLLEERLMSNHNKRDLLFFADKKVNEYYGDVYSTNYKISLAGLAQENRHRSLSYDSIFLEDKEYFIPPILDSYPHLKEKWTNDINSLGENTTLQGELVSVNERGTYENFKIKAFERLCSDAQLEIAMQTKETLENMKKAFENSNHPLYQDIVNYSNGARCTFGYDCPSPCNFKEGIALTRKI